MCSDPSARRNLGAEITLQGFMSVEEVNNAANELMYCAAKHASTWRANYRYITKEIVASLAYGMPGYY